MKRAAEHIELRCEIHLGPLPLVGILHDLLSVAFLRAPQTKAVVAVCTHRRGGFR